MLYFEHTLRSTGNVFYVISFFEPFLWLKFYSNLILKTQSLICSYSKYFYQVPVCFTTSEEELSNILLVILDHWVWFNLGSNPEDRKLLLSLLKHSLGPKATLWVEILREIFFCLGNGLERRISIREVIGERPEGSKIQK